MTGIGQLFKFLKEEFPGEMDDENDSDIIETAIRLLRKYRTIKTNMKRYEMK